MFSLAVNDILVAFGAWSRSVTSLCGNYFLNIYVAIITTIIIIIINIIIFIIIIIIVNLKDILYSVRWTMLTLIFSQSARVILCTFIS